MGGLLNGASLSQAFHMGLSGALWGAVSAGVAFGIGSLYSEMVKGASWGQTTLAKNLRDILHGLSRGLIAKARGQKFSAGFWSGYVSSAFGGVSRLVRSDGAKIMVRAVVGGTAAAIGGGKFANGAVSAAFVMMFGSNVRPSKILNGIIDIAGKIWTLPNTIFGLIYGGVGHILGIFMGLNPSISIGHNAIQFLNNPLQPYGGAITFGNTISYGAGTGPDDMGAYGDYSVNVGLHEEAHTYQFQVYGIFYGPAYLLSGGFLSPNQYGEFDTSLNHFEQEAQDYGRVGGLF